MFPFSAIVGQDKLKRALLVCAVNPTIGGLLISGDKGTAKSTAVRALAALLPQIACVQHCRFNCPPETPSSHCDVCAGSEIHTIERLTPFVDLPLGATEDRLLGALDFERALKSGQKAFQPGLLAAAHRGILYIDEVNLLPDHLVDVLLDVAASGVNTVERESMTLAHPAVFTLVGSMNPEEGELRPQFLDRFAMMVDVKAPCNPAERSEVVRRRIEFDDDEKLFVAAWSQHEDALRASIDRAKALLPAVELAEAQMDSVSSICSELAVKSLRADIFMHKVARTLAALAGRPQVSDEDIRAAASLVLTHRAFSRRDKEQAQGQLDDLLKQMLPPDVSENDHDGSDVDGNDKTDRHQGQQERVFSAAPPAQVSRLAIDRTTSRATGRRSAAPLTGRGAYVRAVPGANGGAVAVDATIRHSLVRNQGVLDVSAEDLHSKERISKKGNLILIAVDASGSMAARERMQAVKGAVLALLEDAYQLRDQVAVVSFRGESAELLLPPTRSVSFAFDRLSSLPTGGTTPLTQALHLVSELVAAGKSDQPEPMLVLLTDGRANVAVDGAGDAWNQALAAARDLAGRGLAALVLDTEAGPVSLGRARILADAMAAEYMCLDELSSSSLKKIIRQRIARRHQ